MKPIGKSKHEFIFTSSFALKDSSSRLRNFAQKRRLQLELEPVDVDTYAFRITEGKWIPSSVSGTLQRDGTSTLIQGTSNVNWTFVGGMVIAGLLLIPFQWTQVLAVVEMLQRIITNLDIADLGSWLSLIFISIILLGQLALAGVFYLTARKALTRPQEFAQMLEKTLSDAITDLPKAGSISNEDGELVTIEALLVTETNTSNLLQK